MPPQTVSNKAYMLVGPATVNPLGCVGNNVYTDTLDIDGDLDKSEVGCKF